MEGRGEAGEAGVRPRRLPVGKFFYLLVSFVLLFLFYPFARTEVVGIGLIDVFTTAIFLAAIFAVSRRRRDLIAAMLVAVPGLAANWATYLVPSVTLAIAGHAFYAAFFAITAVAVLVAVFRSGRTTFDTILGGVCVYFLLGMIWAYVFCLLELLEPGSFVAGGGKLPVQAGGPGLSDESDMVYFSFCTLTTLGYGDIIALTKPARSLAALEAVVGQLYLAVLLARLVALHILHGGHDRVKA
ncbi:MAG TPA: potassium channel family protein [Phycisphaerae bacterium]|nr:potassium channel family protein [Phycisphaerae bacterium]